MLLAVIVLIPAVILAWFAADSVLSHDQAAPGVVVAEHPVGGLGGADLDAAIGAVEAEAGATPIEVGYPGGSMRLTAAEAGFSFDRAATAAAALQAGRDGGILSDLWNWIRSPWVEVDVAPVWSFETTRVAARLVDLPVVSEAVEPSVVVVDGEIVVRPGVPGEVVDPPASASVVAASFTPGDPLAVDAVLRQVDPVTSDAAALGFAADVEAATAEGVVVRMFETTGRISVATLRQNTIIRFDEEVPTFSFDPDGLGAVLSRLFGDVARPGSDPVFDVVDGQPVLSEAGSAPLRCCATDAGTVLAEALLAGDLGPIEVPPTPVGDAALESWAAGGGITEVVGEFTTNHTCCEPRVSNIHRIADLIRGTYLLPGEPFSINDFVGERTEDKGFVPAGVIERGSFTQDVGGGISQFATTFFNAAFFTGLDLDQYQSHSIYISRYPYGREATLSYPLPDLAVTNTTDYPVLVWTSYTDTSITVTMYSTSHLAVEETGQTEEPFGACTQVETFRKRTYPDGRVVEDSVSARYRPGEGLDCNGNPVGT